MITNKIQEETLRTYLFTYSSIYTSLSMQTLSEMFELPRSTVHSVISKMIINEELMVSCAEVCQIPNIKLCIIVKMLHIGLSILSSRYSCQE